MKMSDGVEQAIHSVAMLSGLSEGGVLSAAALAEFHGVSTSYLLKHLQALSGAGILDTVPGPRGGYRLAKPPEEISLLDILLAVEGPADRGRALPRPRRVPQGEQRGGRRWVRRSSPVLPALRAGGSRK